MHKYHIIYSDIQGNELPPALAGGFINAILNLALAEKAIDLLLFLYFNPWAKAYLFFPFYPLVAASGKSNLQTFNTQPFSLQSIG
jgi:hypothetical protein